MGRICKELRKERQRGEEGEGEGDGKIGYLSTIKGARGGRET